MGVCHRRQKINLTQVNESGVFNPNNEVSFAGLN